MFASTLSEPSPSELAAQPTRYESLGRGKLAVPQQTGRRMRAIILESSANPYVRKWAERVTRSLPDRDHDAEIQAIYSFLQNNTRYVADPRGTEYVQTPPFVLTQIEHRLNPGLDCDDYTVTGLSLLRSIGYDTAIRVTGYKPDNRFSHVYGMVRLPKTGEWRAFDCVRKDEPLAGWEAPGKVRQMDLLV
jgi:hypothetical protein